MLGSWNMKKLLGIVVLGLLLSDIGHTDHNPRHEKTIYQLLEDQSRAHKNRQQDRKINRLQGQIQIQNICQMNTDNNIDYQLCICSNFEDNKIGKCDGDWEGRLQAKKDAIQKKKLNEITDFCKTSYPNNIKKFNRCECGSLEKSDIGFKCKDGWRERNRIASKKEKEVDWRKKCSLYAVIKYGKQNCIEKK